MLRQYASSLLMLTVRIASSLVINKIFAFFLGATGITALAHLQNLISLVTLVPADGVGRGLIKYIRDEHVSRQTRTAFIWAGLIWHLLIWLVCGVVLFAARQHFFRLFPAYWTTSQWAILLITTMLGQLLFLWASAVLLAGQQFKLYVTGQMAVSAVLLASVIIGFRGRFLPHTLAAYAAGQGLSLLVVFIVLLKRFNSGFLAKLIHSLPTYRTQNIIKAAMLLGKYSLMALSVAFFGKTVDFFVRQLAVKEFGVQATGIWQAVVRLSELYMQVFIALIGLVYFPQLSTIIHSRKQVNSYLYQTLLLWIPCILAGLAGIYFSRVTLLTVLYNWQFTQGAELLKWQLPADFFTMLSYFFAYILLAKAQINLFIALQALSAGIYLASIYLLPHWAGIEVFSVAYLIRSATYSICLFVLTRKYFL